MATLQEILARAQALREETALGSISPERAGSIMYDTLQQINQMQLEGGSLVISKIYESVAAMQADTTPVSDLTGQNLRQGQLVVIVPSDTSSSDLGSVYRYNGTTEGASSWSFTGKIGGYPMDQTPSQGSTRAVTSGGVYEAVSQLGPVVGYKEISRYVNSSGLWGTSVNYKMYFMKVSPGDAIKVKGNNTYRSYLIYLQDNTAVVGTTPNYASMTPSRYYMAVGEEVNIVAANDMNYLGVFTLYSDQPDAPEEIWINGNLQLTMPEVIERLIGAEGEIQTNAGNIAIHSTEIASIHRQAGSIKYENIDRGWTKTVGAVYGAVGNTATFGTSSGYMYCRYSVTPGDRYKVRTHNTTSTSSSYAYYIIFTDDSEKIIAKAGATNLVYDWVDYNDVIVPAGASRMYVNSANVSTGDPVVELVREISLQEQLDRIESGNGGENSGIVSNESRVFNNAIMEKVIGSEEDALISTALAKVAALNNTRKLNFIIVTDTHQFGTYLDNKNESPIRSIIAAKKISADSKIDFVAHLGDISVDYGTSRGQYIERMAASLRNYIGWPKRIAFAKGNHDANRSDLYAMADPNSLDWVNSTYYIINPSTYNTYVQITQEQWDKVSPLYYRVTRSDKQIPDGLFWEYTRANIPSGVVVDSDNPNGAYFYFDFANYKVRIVVVNDMQVNDSYVFLPDALVGQQFAWLANEALNLSDKDTPGDWQVVILQHTSVNNYESTHKTIMLNIINAFKGGTSVSGSLGGVDYSHDFSGQGAGTFIGNLHGHNHSYSVDTSNGFNDIAFTIAAKPLSTLGEGDNYGVDVVSIDTENRKLYDTRLDGGADRDFNY